MNELHDAVRLARQVRVESLSDLETAISLTTAEVKYAESVVTRTQGAYDTLKYIGSREQYREAERDYAKARDQLLDALARLADLHVQAGKA